MSATLPRSVHRTVTQDTLIHSLVAKSTLVHRAVTQDTLVHSLVAKSALVHGAISKSTLVHSLVASDSYSLLVTASTVQTQMRLTGHRRSNSSNSEKRHDSLGELHFGGGL